MNNCRNSRHEHTSGTGDSGGSSANFIGIDVSAKNVDVAHRQNGRLKACFSVEQTGDGACALAAHLGALKPPPERVAVKVTGVYYLDLAVALADGGLAFSVINPKSVHHFAKFKLGHVKTDRADAALLAEYSERMQPLPWVTPEHTRLGLRDNRRQINRLSRDSVRAKNRLHALDATRLSLAFLIKDKSIAIAALAKRIGKLTAAALTLIACSPALAARFSHLNAAVGVGQASAIAILAELCLLPTTMKANQVARYAGLDVSVQQSGTSVLQPARLSKAGNAYMRGALFMPAMGPVVHDPRANAFYQAVQSRGKKRFKLCAPSSANT